MTYNFNADKFSKPEIYTRKNTSLVHILFEDDEIIGVYQDRLLAEKDAKQMHLIDWHIMARQFQQIETGEIPSKGFALTDEIN